MGIVPNPGFTSDYRRCQKHTFKPRHQQTTTGRRTFYTMGPLLYNSIPSYLRELDDATTPHAKLLVTFKNNLDKYLRTIPDNPGTQGNSLLKIGT